MSIWENAPVVTNDKQNIEFGARTPRLGNPIQSVAPPAVPPAPQQQQGQPQQPAATPVPSVPTPTVPPVQPLPLQQSAPPQQEPPAEPAQLQQPPAQENQLSDQQFSQAFEQRFGVAPEVAATQFQQLQQFAAQQQVMQGKQQLAQDWGVSNDEVERRYSLITQAYENISQQQPQLAGQLDSVTGAKWLWDNVIPEAQRQAQVPPPGPTLDSGRSVLAGSDQGYDFTLEQFNQMDRNETAKNWNAILAAFQNNRVLR